MYYSESGSGVFILRLERGEKVIASINKFCRKLGIKNALINGIGSLENPKLAHYTVDKKKYKEETKEGIFELTGMMGNVAIFRGEQLVHVHVTVSDNKMNVYGGHLVESEVSATVEITLQGIEGEKEKKYDEEIGLKLFDLPDHI